MEDQVVQSIIEALGLVCPIERVTAPYHKTSIIELVNHFKKLGENEHYIYVLSYKESIQVDILNNIIEQIEKDILDDMVSYLWKEDRDKEEYQKIVLNVIRLIQHRVHCICD